MYKLNVIRLHKVKTSEIIKHNIVYAKERVRNYVIQSQLLDL